MTDRITIKNPHLAAAFEPIGAELVSLVPAFGSELMWSGDPVFWHGRAPNLFPIVGTLAGNTLRHRGQSYRMKRHGFLRSFLCALVEHSADACTFRLVDDEASRAQYPFAFAVTIRYRIVGDRLEAGVEVHNPDTEPLLFSVGLHPAFRWPLGDRSREDHVVRFEKPEPAPIRAITADGLIAAEPLPSPVHGATLALHDHLFDHDALVFDQLASRKVTYGAPGGPAIEFDFPDFPELGIWSKPGATPFVCLEPWQGHADPAGFAGEFADKPGILALPPGDTRTWHYSIRPLALMPE